LSTTTGGDTHAFIWEKGVMTDLGTLGGTYSIAYAINDAGQVAGTAQTAAGRYHAFLWEKGVITDLGTLGGLDSEAGAINRHGEVVGYAYTAGNVLHGFLSMRGEMIDLGVAPGKDRSIAIAVNDHGQVTLSNYDAEGTGAASTSLWDKGTTTVLRPLGGVQTQALAMNNRGLVVGIAYTLGGESHAFVWADGVLNELGSGAAVDINNRGEVVLRETS